MEIRLKRIYDKPAEADGFRVLVDRFWPRGMSKNQAQIDLWDKSITPSTPLREWYKHDPSKWDEFEALYWQELSHNQSSVNHFTEELAPHPTVTFLFGAKDPAYSHATILKEFIEQKLKKPN